eukprot:symbB.v1.2.016237.t1/scaffold1230.1/size216073/17
MRAGCRIIQAWRSQCFDPKRLLIRVQPRLGSWKQDTDHQGELVTSRGLAQHADLAYPGRNNWSSSVYQERADMKIGNSFTLDPGTSYKEPLPNFVNMTEWQPEGWCSFSSLA